jgi:hypothetical protein
MNPTALLRSVVFWTVLVAFGAGLFFALGGRPSVYLVRSAGGAMLIVGALGILHGTPANQRDARRIVTIAALVAYGVGQINPQRHR